MAVELLRPGLLDGLRVAVAGSAREGSYGQAAQEALGGLGAEVHMLWCDAIDEAATDAAVDEATTYAAVDEAVTDAAVALSVQEGGGLDVLAVDGAELFVSYGLQSCLAGAWDVTRAVVNGAFLPAERGGRIVYLAPPPSAEAAAPSAGAQADAARAGLENLARTLSIEWARHGITTVAIALGDETTPGEAAALTAYVASPAGAYFSGCQIDLRGV